MRTKRTSSMRGYGKGLLILIGAFGVTSPAMGDVIYQQDFENWNNSDGLWSSGTTASLGGTYTSVLGRFSASTITLDLLATEDNTAGLGGSGGDRPFNIGVDWVENERQRVPYLDGGGGGGGPGGPIGDTVRDGPIINVGETIRDWNQSNGTPAFGPGTYAVRFDLMLFDSWDGDYAPYGPDSFAVAINDQVQFDEIFFAYSPELNFRPPDETPEQNVYNTRWIDNIYRDIEVLVELSEATDRLRVDFIGSPSQSIIDESWGLDNIRIERVSGLRSESVPDVPAPGALVLLGSGLGLMSRRKRESN